MPNLILQECLIRFLEKTKDGGPESPVTGYFLIEIKSLFSIVLLHFGGTREAFHSHAFNAWTYWLKGLAWEGTKVENGVRGRLWTKGQWKYTPRNLMHKIYPITDVWAISFRGPWDWFVARTAFVTPYLTQQC